MFKSGFWDKINLLVIRIKKIVYIRVQHFNLIYVKMSLKKIKRILWYNIVLSPVY